MNSIERLKLYGDKALDNVMLAIRRGEIKCGKYANLVKVDPKKKVKGKEFFKDESK